MIKINKFFRNNSDHLILIIIIVVTVLIVNFSSANKNNQNQKLLDAFENIYLKKTSKHIIKNLNPKFSYINIKVNKGDSFEKIVNNLNISESEKEIIIKNLSKYKFIKNLFQGQNIFFKLNNVNPVKIVEISVQKSKTKNIIFSRIKDLSKFEYLEIEKNLEKVIVYKEAEITINLSKNAS